MRDQRTERLPPALPPAQVRSQIRRLIAIALLHRSRQRPAQIFVRQQRQQECPDKLAVRQPQRTARLPLIDRQHVDKDRPRPLEQHIQRSSVFEDQSLRQQGFAQIERQFRSPDPRRRRPLPRISRKEDPRVFKGQLTVVTRNELGSDEPSAPCPLAGQIGTKEAQCSLCMVGVHTPQDAVPIEAQRTGRIAKCLERQLDRCHYSAVSVGALFSGDVSSCGGGAIRKSLRIFERRMNNPPASIEPPTWKASRPDPGST